jgi:hypothetical protein
MRKGIFALLGVVLMLGLAGAASADINSVTPSTNAFNQANGYAWVSVTPGFREATLTFHTSKSWYSCFEYRTDGDTSQVLSGANYNTSITDGLYPYTCVNGGSSINEVTKTVTVSAKQYVEVRMVFGAENDERFDWTRFDGVQSCEPTDLSQDGMYLTAAQIGGDVTGTLDATGCNIGVYYGPNTTPGSVSNADIFGANYYGVLDNSRSVDVSNSSIHDIGESPLNGAQHGIAIAYDNNAIGTVSGNTVSHYQKNGIAIRSGSAVSVENNVVTGEGPVNYIAQNGIEIFGATALVTGNTVSGNWYTPATVTACGLLFYQADGVKQKANNLFDNQTNLCNAGRGGGNFNG